jgi:hypothetical protein
MGSVLKLGSDVVWPGSVESLLLPYHKMTELLRPDLVATDCIRRFILPQYQSIIDDLKACEFEESAHTLVVCPYDWRKSIQDAADTLAKRISAIHAQQGDAVEISIVAHSMGGLVSRHYLESGKFSPSSGFKNVRNLFMLGVPNRGAAIALPLVLGYEKRLFLSASQVQQLTSDERYPGAYQLLPARGEPVIWDTGARDDFPTVDIYDATVAAKLRLVSKNLDAAVSFQRTLDPSKRPQSVRYFCFSGNRQTTTSHVRLLSRTTGVFAAKIEQQDAGDGTVPIWSSSIYGTQFLYVAGEHGTIYKTRDLRTTLGALLGKPGVLALGKATEIAVQYPVVEPGTQFEATLKLSTDTTSLRGQIVIDRLSVDSSGTITATHQIQSQPIRYEGPIVETLSTILVAPDQKGHYKISFVDDATSMTSAAVELIVQEPTS